MQEQRCSSKTKHAIGNIKKNTVFCEIRIHRVQILDVLKHCLSAVLMVLKAALQKNYVNY